MVATDPTAGTDTATHKATKQGRVRWRFITWTLRAFIWAFLITAVVDGPAEALAANTVAEIVIRIVVFIVAVCIVIAIPAQKPTRDPSQPERTPPQQVTLSDVRWLLASAIRRYPDFQSKIKIYRRFLLTHRSAAAQIIEEYTAESGSLNQTVTKQYVIDSELRTHYEKCESLFMPITILRKGAVLDNLRVYDATGSELPVLPNKAALRLQIIVLHHLFLEAYQLSPQQNAEHQSDPLVPPPSPSPEQQARLRLLEETLFMHIAHRGAMTPERLATTQDSLREYEPPNENMGNLLKAFVYRFGTTYPIVVEIPVQNHSERFLIKYSKAVRIEPVSDSFKDRIRSRIGLGPFKFRLPLPLPFLTPYYIFRMYSRSTEFLYRQELLNLDTGKCIDPENLTEKSDKGQPSLHVRTSGAASYASMHVTDFDRAAPQRIGTIVEFHERPPGSIGSATVVGLLTAALICVIGSLLQSGSALQSDVPALVLAFPAVASGWLGQSFERDQMINSSLAARVGLLASLLISTAGIAAYLARPGGFSHNHSPWGYYDISILGGTTIPIHSGWWLALAAAACLNSLWLAATLILRAYDYRRTLSRQDPISDADVIRTDTEGVVL